VSGGVNWLLWERTSAAECERGVSSTDGRTCTSSGRMWRCRAQLTRSVIGSVIGAAATYTRPTRPTIINATAGVCVCVGVGVTGVAGSRQRRREW